MAQIELSVPDLGGFSDVPVIEVLVKPGDVVKKDDALVTLESDKATMEVPASTGGTIQDVRVKVGDKVSQGTVLATAHGAGEPDRAGATPPEIKPKDVVGIIGSDASASEETGAPPPRPAERADRGTARAATEQLVELKVPDLGGFGDVPVIEVLISPGEAIAKDAPLVTLESEKATMEVPATAGGVVRDVKVKPGDKVSQGTVLATLAAEGADARKTDEQPAVPAPAAAPAPAANGRPAVSTAPAPSASNVASNGAGVHASPAIRRYARELGVDLARVRGSGPNGRVTRDDVQGFVKSALGGGGSATAASSAGGFSLGVPPWPKIDFEKFGPVERVALSRIQKISGPVLARNWVMIPHVTQDEDADVTELEAFRKQINAERKDVKVTMLAFLMKAALTALKRYPQFNASLDGEDLVLKRYYHLGFAADTPSGLIVPVIRDVDRKGIVEIAAETAALAAKARGGKLGPNEMNGSTFTISSLGSIGGTYFTPIINAPEVAILGACKAETRPVWDGQSFVPRLIQPLSLSYDHRVIDGANAARFIVEIKNALADLRRVLL